MTARRALLATDLDGTLLRADGTISAHTREMIARADQAGVGVVFVTGRPPMFLPPVAEATGHRGDVICANGALVVDLHTLEPTEVRIFEPADVLAILTGLADLGLDLDWRVMLHRDGEAALRLMGPGLDVPDEVAAHMAAGWGVFKLAAVSADPSHSPDEFLAQASAMVAGRGEFTHSSYGVPIIEIGPPGVTKGTALAAYADRQGLTSAAVHAVGDMPNDLPMLRWAGTSYAVAGAHPAVLGEVDRVVAGVEQDGVAQVLADLLGDGIGTA